MKFVVWLSASIVAVAFAAALMVRATSAPTRCMQPSPNNACINNLRQIDAAKEQWALENKKSDGDPILKPQILEYIKGGKVTCPASGIYTFGKVGQPPICTIPGHTLN